MVNLLLLLIPLAFVIYVVYKGLNPTFSMILAAILVCLVERMNVLECFLGSGVGPMAQPGLMLVGVNTAVTMFLLKFLAANLFGQIIVHTGAARSISRTLTKAVVDRASGFTKKLLAAYVFMVIAIIFGFGGLDAFVCIFTLMPIGMELFRQNDIPRRLLPAVLFAGVTTAVCCPGTPLTNGNILASMFFGTSTTAAFIPGIVGVIVVLVCDCLYIRSALKKAEKNDEHFTPGGNIRPADPDEKLPNFVLSILPLLVVAVLNMILGIDVVLALTAGAVVAAVSLCNFIATPEHKIQPYADVIGQGITAGGMIFIPMAFQQGLATVIQAIDGFAYLSNALTQLALNTSPYLSYALSATFSGFLAGNAVTGIQLSSGIFMPLMGQIAISPAAMHRIGCFAISILDTIPINAAVISGLATCGLTHKEGYMPIFRTTVLYIFFGMLAVILMCVLFPGLAV
ncbi:MAG: GntP family permease [Oscillospiraceae bacterium]|nr:GntP family permease [Oscillospiraceae bacterium]